MEYLDVNKVVEEFSYLAGQIREVYGDITNSNQTIEIYNRLADGVYNCCLKNEKRKIIFDLPHHNNCEAEIFKAIADAHFARYCNLVNTSSHEAMIHQKEWLKYDHYALIAGNTKRENSRTKKLNHLLKKDPKKLWEILSWKEKENKERRTIPSSIIEKYFRRIFQAEKMMNYPKLVDVKDLINEYENEDETLDLRITRKKSSTQS